MSKQLAAEAIEADRERLIGIATDLWERPEVSLEESAAADRLSAVLRDEGFALERGVGDLPTSFVARYGNGGPTVGLIAEYDALPGLSQRPTARREPVEPGAPGHGCGHNLFAAGSFGAAIGVKRLLEAGRVDGSVVLFGTPAEEILVGKPAMIRAGAFDGVDAVLTWHPGWYTGASVGSCLAMDAISFTYTGEAAHAASSPEAGRSALDAVQLMNVGVEFLREHVPDSARIHYGIDDAGAAPNVVDPTATVSYFVRAEDRAVVTRVADRVRDVARGAATMTGTDLTIEERGGTYGLLPNHALADVLDDNLRSLGGHDVPEADRALASDLRETLDAPEEAAERLPAGHREPARERALYTEPVPAWNEGRVGPYSTDTGNVSWVVPVGTCRIATWPVGTPAHSWQAVAASGSVGLHAVPYVAKALAGGVHDLLTDPAVLERAGEEFASATAGFAYEDTLPAGTAPTDLG